MKRAMIYAGVIALVLILLLLLPQIDLVASRMFYVPGQEFVLSGWPPVIFLYHAVPLITRTILGIVAAAGLWLFLVGRPIWRLDRKALIFLLASLALGPDYSLIPFSRITGDARGRRKSRRSAARGSSHLLHCRLRNAQAIALSFRATPRSASRSLPLPSCYLPARRAAASP